MIIIKGLFILILFIFALNAFTVFIRFWVDVGKWHKAEKQVNIISSKESEVIESERDNYYDTGRTDHNDFDRSPGADGTGDRERTDFEL